MTHRLRWIRTCLFGLIGGVAGMVPVAPALAEPSVTVFAAASLRGALDEAVDAFAAETGTSRPRITYAGSAALARQIEAGAPADVFISADQDWMDYLAARELINPASRVDLLGNALVWVVPRDAPQRDALGSLESLLAALGDGHIAVARVDSVPAGKYARSALQALGWWPALEGRLAQADDVRQALAFVARGEAPLGIVYRSDAMSGASVRVLGTFPAASHAPIVYPGALLRETPAPRAAGQLLAFLQSAQAKVIFARHGFDTAPGMP